MSGAVSPFASVVHLVHGKMPAVELALHALAAAVERAESIGDDVEVVVVDTTEDVRVKAFLSTLGGAHLMTAVGASMAEALALVLPQLRGSTVWFGGSESCPHQSAVVDLVSGASTHRALALAHSDQPAPYAAAPRDLLGRALQHHSGSGRDFVPWFATWAAENEAVTTTPGVGAMTQVQRSGRDFGATLDLRGDLFAVGPATYSQPTTLVKTYTPIDSIEIGGYCAIADEVRIINFGGRVYSQDGRLLEVGQRGLHRPSAPTSFPIGILVPEESYDEPPPGSVGERLRIGDDVWIGYGARVMGAVSVGTGAIVASGALVVKDVPPYAVVGGVPARILKYRFDEDVRRRLLNIQWWNWPEALVHGAHRWLSGDTPAFVDHFDPAGSCAPAPTSVVTAVEPLQ